MKEILEERLSKLKKVVGLVITALAVSLGAPFWFDTLNKLVNLRGAGAQPKKTGASN